MTFLWPEMLWFLGVIPLLVLGYVLALRKKRQTAIRYASLSIFKAARPGRNLRRHLQLLCRQITALADVALQIVKSLGPFRLDPFVIPHAGGFLPAELPEHLLPRR